MMKASLHLAVLFFAAKAMAGEITCAGADTMQAIAQSWADAFNRTHPGGAAVDSGTKLSAEGFDLLLQGKADCVTYVREPFPAELKAYREKFGADPLVLTVAGGSYATKSGTHAIAIYVNAVNPLTKLSLTELQAVLSQKTVTRWGQLGLTGEWADRPIHAYGMPRRRGTGNPPGIVNFIEQRALGGRELRDDIRETALDDIVRRIAGDPDGIGFSGFAFAAPGAKTLALAETAAGPYYAGTPAEVANRLYPLSRSLYLMIRPAEGGRLSGPQRDFLRGVLAEEGQRIVAADRMGFLPLDAAQTARSLAALERY